MKCFAVVTMETLVHNVIRNRSIKALKAVRISSVLNVMVEVKSVLLSVNGDVRTPAGA